MTKFGLYAGIVGDLIVDQRERNLRAADLMAATGALCHYRMNVHADRADAPDWDMLYQFSTRRIALNLHLKPELTQQVLVDGKSDVTIRAERFLRTFVLPSIPIPLMHTIDGGHEIHDTLPLELRIAVTALVRRLSRMTPHFYCGHAVNVSERRKMLENFGQEGVPIIAHVALNHAKATAEDPNPFTAAAVRQGAEMATTAPASVRTRGHINLPPDTTAATLLRLSAVAQRFGPEFDCIYFRTVDADGNTLTEIKPDGTRGKAIVPDAVLETLKELAAE